jgi:hypothetical protein
LTRPPSPPVPRMDLWRSSPASPSRESSRPLLRASQAQEAVAVRGPGSIAAVAAHRRPASRPVRKLGRGCH